MPRKVIVVDPHNFYGRPFEATDESDRGYAQVARFYVGDKLSGSVLSYRQFESHGVASRSHLIAAIDGNVANAEKRSADPITSETVL